MDISAFMVNNRHMKNLIWSILIVGGLTVGGYYLFEGNSKVPTGDSLGIVMNNAYSSANEANAIAAVESAPAASATATVPTNNKINKHMVTIETNYGKIVFETYDADAPNTVKNFITLASKGFYNGLTFHRVIKGFMIQGGDPSGNGTGGPGYKFDDELDPATPSYKAGYKKGVVAMANAGPNTNGSQFFIMTADYPLPNAYTIFGKVVSGQEVVDAIANVQTGANDKPISPVIMKTVSAE